MTTLPGNICIYLCDTETHLCQQIIGQSAHMIPGPSLVQVNLGLHWNCQKLNAHTHTHTDMYTLENNIYEWIRYKYTPGSAEFGHVPVLSQAARPGDTGILHYWRHWSSAAEANWPPSSKWTQSRSAFDRLDTLRPLEEQMVVLTYLLLNVPNHDGAITAGRGLKQKADKNSSTPLLLKLNFVPPKYNTECS